MKLPVPPNPEQIRFEAQKAAWLYDTVLQACPFHYGTEAARIFTSEFDLAKQAKIDAGMTAVKVHSGTQDKREGKYTGDAGAYYRNNGNAHVPSAGTPC